MAAERLFQSPNRLTIQCNNEGVRYNPDEPRVTCMKLGRKCSEKRLIFLPYEGFRPLNTSFSVNRASILCSNTGIASTHRDEKMGIRCGERKVNLYFKLDHQVSFGEHHAVLGSSKAFGAWKKKLMMSWSESEWILDLETRGGEKVEYKFVIVSGDGKIIWEGGHNRVLDLPKEGRFEIVCHWDKTQEALDLQRMDRALAALQTLDMKKEATSSNGKPQVETYENVAEASPFVQGWQVKDITFMRYNGHSTRERKRSWNTSCLEGSAGKLVEVDQNKRNWWRKDLLATRLTCGLRNRDSETSKPSKSPGDRTRPEPHQPLTWLDFFVPAGFKPMTLTTRSGLTTHSVTNCPTPRRLVWLFFNDNYVSPN